MMKKFLTVCVIVVSFSLNLDASEKLIIGDFSSGKLEPWKIKEFQGNTDYRLVTLGKVTVLKAVSIQAASGLFLERHVDLTKTPYLNWRWRIENYLEHFNEEEKSGDDFAARIYVVVDGGWKFWNTKAINYVWSSNTTKGKIWPNAFAGTNAMMIALRSRDDKINVWKQEKRNILGDIRQLFGADIHSIDAVAIMTDTDNALGKATAYYGDIYFSKN